MKQEIVKTEILKESPENAKKHDAKQVRNIAESIKQFGFVQPIVINEDGEVVIGHGRLRAARTLGIETVPVVRVENLTPEEQTILRIIDNKLNESPWDVSLLSAEIETTTFEGFDIDWGEAQPEEDLTEPFRIAPTSAFRGESGTWLRRKKAWLRLGITSEKGR